MGKTLLLADDSVTIQKVVGISFASEDIAIVTVDNGDDAITKARELRPDVILADVVMPGKSGYEVCQAIKGDASLSHVPVLLLTGTFEAFDEEHATAVGASGHVSKPFEAQTLVDRVKELLANAPAPAAKAETRAMAPSVPDPERSFDFFEDAGDDFSLGAPSAAPAPAWSPAPALDSGDGFEIGGNDAFAFGDDDLGETLDPIAPSAVGGDPIPEATVAMLVEPSEDPAATVVHSSFYSDDRGPASDPVGFAFSDDRSGAQRSADVEDSLAISSSDLFASEVPEPPPIPTAPVVAAEPVAPPEPPPAVDPLLAPDAFDSASPLPGFSDYSSDPLGEDIGFATPIDDDVVDDDDPMGATARADAIDSPFSPASVPPPASANPLPEQTPDPEPPPAVPFAEPEPIRAEPLGLEVGEYASSGDLRRAEPQDATAFMMPEAPTAPSASAPEAEVPVQAEPSPSFPVEVDATPEPEPQVPGAGAESLMGDSEPLMVPEVALAPPPPKTLSPDAVNRLVEDITPALREELHQTLERIAWESFGSVTEQLVAQAVERIETIAWEVVPKLAETLIEEEIRKLKGES